MRLGVIQNWIDRYNTVGVNALVTVVIVAHDVTHVHRLSDARPFVELSSVSPQVGVIDQPLAIALEVQVIHGIKSD